MGKFVQARKGEHREKQRRDTTDSDDREFEDRKSADLKYHFRHQETTEDDEFNGE